MKTLAYLRDRLLHGLHRARILPRQCTACAYFEGGIACVAGKPGWGVDVCPADVPPDPEAYR